MARETAYDQWNLLPFTVADKQRQLFLLQGPCYFRESRRNSDGATRLDNK
mgnify:CR=1 FL=1